MARGTVILIHSSKTMRSGVAGGAKGEPVLVPPDP